VTAPRARPGRTGQTLIGAVLTVGFAAGGFLLGTLGYANGRDTTAARQEGYLRGRTEAVQKAHLRSYSRGYRTGLKDAQQERRERARRRARRASARPTPSPSATTRQPVPPTGRTPQTGCIRAYVLPDGTTQCTVYGR
jgi:hypothetical protein